MKRFRMGVFGRLTAIVAMTLFAAVEQARGEFVGLSIFERTADFGGDVTQIAVFELYARFDHPDDTLIQVFDVKIVGSGNFVHLPPDVGEDGAFPLKKQTYDALGSEIDSFVTVGFKYKGGLGNPDGPDAGTGGDLNQFQLTPGFCKDMFLNGNTVSTCGGDGTGWFPVASVNNIQAKAGTYPDLKILLGRFVVSKTTPGCGSIEVVNLSLTYKLAGGTNELVTDIEAYQELCTLLVDCNGNLIDDAVEIARDPAIDCDLDGVIDACAPPPGPVGDFNGDTFVNGADLGLLLAAWGTAECAIDLNDDGNVDGADLGVLLSEWTG